MNNIIELTGREQREQAHQERVESYIEMLKEAFRSEHATCERKEG